MTALDISLPRFEGPLDMLLDLVRRHEVDIADIPIAEITRQYFDYLQRAEELDIDLGADFTYIAALLIHIKSKLLLASQPELEAQLEDPRQELVELLIERRHMREAAEFLQQKLDIAGSTWSRSRTGEFAAGDDLPESSSEAMNLLEVLRLAKKALDTARSYDALFPPETVSVRKMQRWLEDELRSAPELVCGTELLRQQWELGRGSALFLAMLEMAKEGRIRLEQQECFGPFSITSHLCRNPKS